MQNKEIIASYTAEDIAQSFVLPVKLTPKQQKLAADELAKQRAKTQSAMSEKTRLSLELLQLKFRLEDYISSNEFDKKKTFGSFFKIYLKVVKKKEKEFAQEIKVHETTISQLVNDHRNPKDAILIKLEIHSNHNIPVDYWFKLVEKKKLHELKRNKSLFSEAKKSVSSKLELRV